MSICKYIGIAAHRSFSHSVVTNEGTSPLMAAVANECRMCCVLRLHHCRGPSCGDLHARETCRHPDDPWNSMISRAPLFAPKRSPASKSAERRWPVRCAAHKRLRCMLHAERCRFLTPDQCSHDQHHFSHGRSASDQAKPRGRPAQVYRTLLD